MKRHVFALTVIAGTAAAVFGASHKAQAQFNSTVPGVTYTTDNVGIGLSSPASMLHIASGYDTQPTLGGGCSYGGKPALSILWNIPSTQAQPCQGSYSNVAPNILDVTAQATSPSQTFTYLVLNSAGQMGIRATPANNNFLSVGGNTFFNANSQIVGKLSVGNSTAYNYSTWQGQANTFSVESGNANFNNDVTVGGDLQNHPGIMQRVTIGPAWGGSGMYGGGYIGFNWARDVPYGNNWSYFGDGSSNGASLIYSVANGDMIFANRTSNGGGAGTSSDADIVNAAKMRITTDGKVIIGNPAKSPNISWGTANKFSLYVQDGILTERVRVAVRTTADWSDFVFDGKYQLMPLQKLEQYIQTNKHLPDVPAADEVVSKGVDLQQMDARLLQKVEELTLYVIALKKEVEVLKVKTKRSK